MKYLFSFVILLFFSITIFSQKSEVKQFDSNELGATRILKIHIPKSYKKDGDRVYPLTIVLDSEYLFDVYVANAKLFSNKDKAPEQIIVGIAQNQNQEKERYTDCAYDKITSMPSPKSTQFYRFIRNEVLDYMEDNYRISPFKTIVGNTLTANFTNYFLLEKAPAFQAYINLNPSYALDIREMLRAKIPQIENSTYYYIISGSYNSKSKKIVDDIDALFKTSKNEMFNYRYDEMNGSTKVASIGQGIASSLAFIFDQYSAISKEEYKRNVANLSPPDAIEYLEKKYVEIEYLFGANIKIRERDIYAIEGIIIDKEEGDYLQEFGKMINRLYPESPIGDYYIGKYFEMGKVYKKALKYYKNGFSKIADDDPNKDGYYQNVERVLELRMKSREPEPEPDEDEEANPDDENNESNPDEKENEAAPNEDSPNENNKED